jgi:hypothetical protein
VWFVATQNVELIEELQLAYGSRKVVSFNGTITTTFDVGSEGQRVRISYNSSLVPFLLLSFVLFSKDSFD